jgi:transcriptional regulator with XRE-family HTH domain
MKNRNETLTRLKLLRLQRGWILLVAARKTGMNPSRWSQIERLNIEPSATEREKLARAFNEPVDQLLRAVTIEVTSVK